MWYHWYDEKRATEGSHRDDLREGLVAPRPGLLEGAVLLVELPPAHGVDQERVQRLALLERRREVPRDDAPEDGQAVACGSEHSTKCGNPGTKRGPVATRYAAILVRNKEKAKGLDGPCFSCAVSANSEMFSTATRARFVGSALSSSACAQESCFVQRGGIQPAPFPPGLRPQTALKCSYRSDGVRPGLELWR